MALAVSYSSAAEATADLIANGFTAAKTPGYFAKNSVRGDNALIPAIALCSITHNRVDPEYNSPDYFTIRFI